MNQVKYSLAFMLIFSYNIAFTQHKPKLGETDLVDSVRIVVIDAGHGGGDPGCQHFGYDEKVSNLKIALKLGTLIRINFPKVRIIYTRKEDTYLTLEKRADIANQAFANLFISIHANSTDTGSGARGTETFYFDPQRDFSLYIEQDSIENQDTISHYAALHHQLDTTFEVDTTLCVAYQDTTNEPSYGAVAAKLPIDATRSRNMAQMVENEMKRVTKRKSYGAKQGAFRVLHLTNMPSILVETGFLSNKDEAEYLMSNVGQDSIAKALFYAFRRYKYSIEGEPKPPKIKPEPPKSDDSKPKPNSKPKLEIKPEITYRVQLGAFSKPQKITSKSTKIQEIKEGKIYKYFSKQVTQRSDAEKLQMQLVKAGFRGAFIVAFKNGKKG